MEVGMSAMSKEPLDVSFGWDTGKVKGRKRGTEGRIEGKKTDHIHFPGLTMGNCECPAKK
jgi:hypothetical protein